MPGHQNTVVRLCLGLRGMWEKVPQSELCVLKENGSSLKENEDAIIK